MLPTLGGGGGSILHTHTTHTHTHIQTDGDYTKGVVETLRDHTLKNCVSFQQAHLMEMFKEPTTRVYLPSMSSSLFFSGLAFLSFS